MGLHVLAKFIAQFIMPVLLTYCYVNTASIHEREDQNNSFLVECRAKLCSVHYILSKLVNSHISGH